MLWQKRKSKVIAPLWTCFRLSDSSAYPSWRKWKRLNEKLCKQAHFLPSMSLHILKTNRHLLNFVVKSWASAEKSRVSSSLILHQLTRETKRNPSGNSLLTSTRVRGSLVLEMIGYHMGGHSDPVWNVFTSGESFCSLWRNPTVTTTYVLLY